MNASEPLIPPKPLSVRKTLKSATRAIWDYLGTICAISITFFAGLSIPLLLLLALNPLSPGIGLAAFLLSSVLFIAPLFGGICYLSHRIYSSDEPSYLHIWIGFIRYYRQSLLLGVLQLLISGILLANLLFYLSKGSLPFLILGVLFLYINLFWCMNCLYHWPVLIASGENIIQREGGGTPGLFSVIRNSFLLTASAPAFTFAIWLFIMAVCFLLLISAVGMALLGTGVVSMYSARAARDQFVKFGLLPQPVDPDEPILDEGWKLS
jgi:uncharacterized membrane protein YesL